MRDLDVVIWFGLFEVVAAAFTAVFLSAWFANVWLAYRARMYAKFEQGPLAPDPFIERHPILSARLSPQAEEIRQRGTDLLADGDRAARRAQDHYHVWLARAVCALGLGFLGLSIGATMGAENDHVARFTAALDVACFALSFVSFANAVNINWTWLRTRIRNELLRQWCSLDNLFLAYPDPPDVQGRQSTYAARVDEEVLSIRRKGWLPTFFSFLMSATSAWARPRSVSRHELDFVSTVEAHWERRKQELAGALEDAPLTRQQVSVYFWKRPFKQLDWS